jgi:hypothetical protein
MRFRLLETPVVRIGRPIAPRGLVGLGGGRDGGRLVSFGNFNFCQHVVGVNLAESPRWNSRGLARADLLLLRVSPGRTRAARGAGRRLLGNLVRLPGYGDGRLFLTGLNLHA